MPEGTQSREHIQHNLAEEVLRRTGQVRLAALGCSMLPSLWPGDQVTIEARDAGQVRIGDIVAFRRDQRLFIHRAIQVETSPLWILARGDAMPGADAPVSPEELLGVVTVLYGADGSRRPAPGSSQVRRLVGLALAYSGRLRSLALRWHARRKGAAADAGVGVEHGSLS